MNKIREFLKGKKTYIVGSLTAIIGAIIGNVELVSFGIMALTGRAAISELEKKLLEELVK